jgi:hypothetical protein
MKSSWVKGIAAAVAGGGVLLGVMAATPAFGTSASPAAATPPKIFSASRPGTFKLHNANNTIVSLKVPAAKWLLNGKLWADSQPAKPTPNTVVGCSMFKGSTILDASAFQSPKLNGPGGSSAGVEELSAVIKTSRTVTVTLRCNDFGSMAQSHNAVLTAIGG